MPYVMCATSPMGHLTNEAGKGNRMEDQAKLGKLEPMEIVQNTR